MEQNKNKNKKEECKNCQVSDEIIQQIKNAGKEKKKSGQGDGSSEKKGFWKSLFGQN